MNFVDQRWNDHAAALLNVANKLQATDNRDAAEGFLDDLAEDDAECGTALDKNINDAIRSSTNGNDLRSLRDGVSQAAVAAGANPVLQPEVYGIGSHAGTANGALQMVRDAGNAGSAGEGSEFLQQGVRVALDGEEPQDDNGSLHHVEGLCGDLQARSSERVEGGLCDGAPAGDGGAARPALAGNGDCPPQGRRPGKQYRQQPRSDDEGPARQITQGANGQGSLSALRRTDPSVPACPCCGANLAHIRAIVPGTVLDCFGGAGTTGVVADRLKRDAILIELNPEYAAMAKRRIEGDGGMFVQASLTPAEAAE